MISAWKPAPCRTCGRDTYKREHDYSSRYAEHYYVEYALHWDWMNRICLATRKWWRE